MPPHPSTWLEVRPEGLLVRPGGFFVDPVRPVASAVISHGHADHARPGHGTVVATPETLAIMALRLGDAAGRERRPLPYGQTVTLGEVRLRLAPAGHILGSAQVILEYAGTRVVVSGDYKRSPDPTCAPFAPVPCDLFVTEATFALPVFRHPPAEGEVTRLLASLRLFPDRTHVVGVYALGKAQRLLALLRAAGYDAPIWLHGALAPMTEVYRRFGQDFGDLRPATVANKDALRGAIVLAPPGAIQDRWARRLNDPVVAPLSLPGSGVSGDYLPSEIGLMTTPTVLQSTATPYAPPTTVEAWVDGHTVRFRADVGGVWMDGSQDYLDTQIITDLIVNDGYVAWTVGTQDSLGRVVARRVGFAVYDYDSSQWIIGQSANLGRLSVFQFENRQGIVSWTVGYPEGSAFVPREIGAAAYDATLKEWKYFQTAGSLGKRIIVETVNDEGVVAWTIDQGEVDMMFSKNLENLRKLVRKRPHVRAEGDDLLKLMRNRPCKQGICKWSGGGRGNIPFPMQRGTGCGVLDRLFQPCPFE